MQVLYFLTGEHQEYDKREGVFGRVISNNDYHLKKCDDHYMKLQPNHIAGHRDMPGVAAGWINGVGVRGDDF